MKLLTTTSSSLANDWNLHS